ncbi:hypothetical protein L228DRAFT_169687 [Xylona heveae TC161]|uniref:Uncharacterized protein n=1 Tax=Xylona heveae (strain CBS 132557 / TC161) TaxID=1328760 RepID=A0A165FR74_XYLHT|nr:hypothetical protein L228DRAFT_169687 [Xylona heveae TC161]KZF21280.1 hypothetical protein L228DRAFT_169687 [Xylona heveae TC161]
MSASPWRWPSAEKLSLNLNILLSCLTTFSFLFLLSLFVNESAQAHLSCHQVSVSGWLPSMTATRRFIFFRAFSAVNLCSACRAILHFYLVLGISDWDGVVLWYSYFTARLGIHVVDFCT